MEHIKCVCDRRDCPAFSRCCFLPTEYFPDPEGRMHILFVGQGGGKDERKIGRPFIGRAGKRLRKIVVHIRTFLERDYGVGFANTIRDNPLDNRIPEYDELQCCLPYLHRDIKTLKGLGLGCVIPLGNAAKRALIKDSRKTMSDHGSVYYVEDETFGSIPMIATFHPSFLCRKHQVWKPADLERPHTEEKPNYQRLALGDIQKALDIAGAS